jgi:spore coat-associated protein N
VFSPSSIFAATPRRLLLALGGLAIATAVAVGSGANFNSTSANPGTLITTGSISVTDSAAGSAILNAALMKPGGSSSGSVNIQNGGNVPATLTLAKASVTDTPSSPALSAKLTLEVQDLGNPSCVSGCPAPVTIYTGTLGSMGNLSLGAFAAGATHRYTFTVSFPEGARGADNAYEGATSKVEYLWTATQS